MEETVCRAAKVEESPPGQSHIPQNGVLVAIGLNRTLRKIGAFET